MDTNSILQISEWVYEYPTQYRVYHSWNMSIFMDTQLNINENESGFMDTHLNTKVVYRLTMAKIEDYTPIINIRL